MLTPDTLPAVPPHLPPGPAAQVLQDSLCGSSKVLLVCCVSPEAASAQESLSSLNFASRAAQVELGPIKKAHDGTPGAGAKKQAAAVAAAGQSPLTPGSLAMAAAGGRGKLAGTPQSGSKPRSALRDANGAH